MRHILIADDEPQIVNLLRQVIDQLGWTCDIATNGREAISIMERVHPQLVISDVNMPFVRGVDVVRHMKSNPELAQIPTILMSSPDVKAEAIASGCTMFVAKPFNIGELTNLLAQVASEYD